MLRGTQIGVRATLHHTQRPTNRIHTLIQVLISVYPGVLLVGT